jgi:hypothetical protein
MASQKENQHVQLANRAGTEKSRCLNETDRDRIIRRYPYSRLHSVSNCIGLHVNWKKNPSIVYVLLFTNNGNKNINSLHSFRYNTL